MLPRQFLSGIFDSAVQGYMSAIPGHADTFLIQYMDLVFIDLIRLGYYIVAATDELSAIQSSKILQRNIYFRGKRDNSYVNVIPALHMVVARAKPFLPSLLWAPDICFY